MKIHVSVNNIWPDEISLVRDIYIKTGVMVSVEKEDKTGFIVKVEDVPVVRIANNGQVFGVVAASVLGLERAATLVNELRRAIRETGLRHVAHALAAPDTTPMQSRPTEIRRRGAFGYRFTIEYDGKMYEAVIETNGGLNDITIHFVGGGELTRRAVDNLCRARLGGGR